MTASHADGVCLVTASHADGVCLVTANHADGARRVTPRPPAQVYRALDAAEDLRAHVRDCRRHQARPPRTPPLEALHSEESSA